MRNKHAKAAIKIWVRKAFLVSRDLQLRVFERLNKKLRAVKKDGGVPTGSVYDENS